MMVSLRFFRSAIALGDSPTSTSKVGSTRLSPTVWYSAETSAQEVSADSAAPVFCVASVAGTVIFANAPRSENGIVSCVLPMA